MSLLSHMIPVGGLLVPDIKAAERRVRGRRLVFWREGAELFVASSHPFLPSDRWLSDRHPVQDGREQIAVGILARNIRATHQAIEALGYAGYRAECEATR